MKKELIVDNLLGRYDEEEKSIGKVIHKMDSRETFVLDEMGILVKVEKKNEYIKEVRLLMGDVEGLPELPSVCRELTTIVPKMLKRLEEEDSYDAHVCLRVRGDNVGVKVEKGVYKKAVSLDTGEDYTEHLRETIEEKDLESLSHLGTVLIRGVKSRNKDKGKDDLVVYGLLSRDYDSETVEQDMSYLESLGFEIPLSLVVDELTAKGTVEELPEILEDCLDWVYPDRKVGVSELEFGEYDIDYGEVSDYAYETVGVIFEVNDYYTRRELKGISGVDLRVGHWGMEVKTGYIKEVYWEEELEGYVTSLCITEDPSDVSKDQVSYEKKEGYRYLRLLNISDMYSLKEKVQYSE